MMIGLLQLRHHVSDDIQDMREVDRHTDHYRRLYMKCSLHTYGSSGHLETMRKMWGLRTDFTRDCNHSLSLRFTLLSGADG